MVEKVLGTYFYPRDRIWKKKKPPPPKIRKMMYCLKVLLFCLILKATWIHLFFIVPTANIDGMYLPLL